MAHGHIMQMLSFDSVYFKLGWPAQIVQLIKPLSAPLHVKYEVHLGVL